jgi:hypothetical protein
MLLWQGYGMTEACGVISREYLVKGQARRFGSTGMLVTGVEGKIIDLDTLRHLPPNQLGEICTRGSHIMQGENLVLPPYLLSAIKSFMHHLLDQLLHNTNSSVKNVTMELQNLIEFFS